MSYDAPPVRLTILDLCRPDFALEVAPRAEDLGYSRYWVTTHLGPGAYSSSPEIMASLVAATTDEIRVGTAGIPLLFNGPLQIASNWKMLATMFPERIDLGVLRAPGISRSPKSEVNDALQELMNDGRAASSFEDRFELLRGLVYGFPEGHRFASLPIAPPIADDEDYSPPQLWLLGSSVSSATFAAKLGVYYAFSEGAGGRELGLESIAAYRRHFVPSPWLSEPAWSVCISGVCAEDEKSAQALASEFAGIGNAIAREPVCGSPSQCGAFFAEMRRAYGASELVFADLCEDLDAKIRSYSWLAETLRIKDAPPMV